MAFDLSSQLPLYIEDELLLLRHCVALAGKNILDIGCGAGAMTQRIAAQEGVAQVLGIEVDEHQLQQLKTKSWAANLAFAQGSAEHLQFADASFDCVTLFKSLHHVPIAFMAQALEQIRRVLKPGGTLFVSEPVYAGAFNDLMKIFHDEGVVRAAAIEALDGTLAKGLFSLERHVDFFAPVAFKNFADFETKMMYASHNALVFSPELHETIRLAYAAHQSPSGATFVRPMRVEVFIKPLSA